MTILLHDVAHILGLAVEGEAIVVDTRQLEKWSLEADTRALMGLDHDDPSLSTWYRGYGLLGVAALTHLKESGPPAREAQCYLLLLLGSTLFVDRCWIYDHFPTLRPSRLEPRELEQGHAGAFRWRGISPQSTKKRDAQMLAYYRQEIDSLTPQAVSWTPYGQSPHLTVRCTLYQDLLRFAEIVEPYEPTRCLRQLGYVQSVP
ncbi:unnamed protein product [Linum tenue]|uniref:Aminotransferase-like plant mobile domain-containing protein n=1 Tax=Linum tenue TaxID=586396 RepID=A0AAV0I3U7_9ROSI|nr:unnamed protein product [Linum tenue]